MQSASDTAPRPFSTAQIERGANLAAIGNCVTCHTAHGGKPYAGGYPVQTPFGAVHGTNITPDRETGIGSWSLADFTRALREGMSPEGHHYYPAFPYAYFTHLDDDDIAALYAFVMTREPVRAAVPANSVLVPRFAVAIWNARYLHRGALASDASRDAGWNRGHYLAESLAHCSECHTPRDKLGGEKRNEYLAGGEAGGWEAPALNQNSSSPQPWTSSAMGQYLRTGLVDEHAISAGPMRGVVENLSHAKPADVDALARYIVSMERKGPDMANAAPPAASAHGEELYAGACGECHDRGRAAEGGALQLGKAIAVALPTPKNLIHIVQDGITPREDSAQPWMPAFRGSFTDEDLADLLAYTRTLGRKPAWNDVQGQVRAARREGEGK
ncbi:MAG TPA: cytochrome c [Usitatibacter sp.]|nr:cytochrome c [Usitatibacter sp.]